MSYTKKQQQEWNELFAYVQEYYFDGKKPPKVAETNLRKTHKIYTFKEVHNFLIDYRKTILSKVNSPAHLANRINWYIENKMPEYVYEQKKNEMLSQPIDESFHFISYHNKPTPAPPDYDIL